MPELRRPRAAAPSCSWLVAALFAACATADGPPGAAAGPADAHGKYPRRGAGCEIAIYHTAVPAAAAWDDLGIAEIACHVSASISHCTQMLKAEGCRMGGDMIYNVPREPLRPQDQVLVFRGQVAHTLLRNPKPTDADDKDLPPPASAAESALPVVPLTGPAAPKAP